MLKLRPFQRTFLKNALRPEVGIAALCLPRGNGKSTLSGFLGSRIMTPGDQMFHAGKENIIVAGSLQQGRIIFKIAKGMLGDDGYRYVDTQTKLQITHLASDTRLRVQAANPKTALGIVDCPFVLVDEPGAWEVNAGTDLWDAIDTARGKPDSPMKVIIVGTKAPALTGWWIDLVDGGSGGDTYVMMLAGDVATWDSWQTIRRANPLMSLYPASRAQLLAERDRARGDSHLKARFLSFRLNVPSADESVVLLTTDDWQMLTSREVPDRGEDQPVVGVDLGGGRSFSAAVAIWPSGRVEAMAVAPGIPDLQAQERRDRVPRGSYETLRDIGALEVAGGLHVQPPAQLVAGIQERWGTPRAIVCDRFRLADLRDAARGLVLQPRATMWAQASEDIRAVRKLTRDGGLAVAEDSRLLIAASLAVATVQNDTSGNSRMIKSRNNTARDDVCAALALASGAHERFLARPVGGGYFGPV